MIPSGRCIVNITLFVGLFFVPHLTWGNEHQLQTQVGDLRGVSVPIPLRQPAGHHVAVIDCLHLVHVIALDPDACNYFFFVKL